ncbi:MAG: ATP-binding cassette domain-containing protein [Magnetococcales bacterium]|nr:ATP-binding cassette domain-containing protein [Magnetococcales bacterium]
MSAIIQAKQILKQYNGVTVVDRISFDVQHGECFGILGPNGAGKTTTMRMIIGLAGVTEGQLHVFGYPMSPEQRLVPPRLGVVSQEDNLDIDLSVSENLLVYGRYFGLSARLIREQIPKLLEFAQLSDRGASPVRELSGGMKRRLVIARSLINNPELVTLDEPTTGLDPQARHLIWQRLRALKEKGTTLLLTTHYMEEAAQICDRLLILNHGQILDQGTPADLIKRHVESEVVEIRGCMLDSDLDCFENLPGRLERVGDTLFCYTHNADSVMAALKDHSALTLLLRPSNLEDVFLKLTGRELRD